MSVDLLFLLKRRRKSVEDWMKENNIENMSDVVAAIKDKDYFVGEEMTKEIEKLLKRDKKKMKKVHDDTLKSDGDMVESLSVVKLNNKKEGENK